MTSPAPFLSRHFGDYTLVAQLSEDSLGTVYRALYSADERRFVRLRMFHPDAVSEAAIARAIHEHTELAPILVHDTVVSHPQLDMVDGVAFMTWDETAGWTLDTMLARVRALGIRIPAEYALLVAERVAACLEHAFRAAPDGRPTPHGLLWPGFVSISHDATVRVGGFAVADAVLPSLHTPKLLAEIGPYIAPEVRGVGIAGENSDVYSLGAILMELLTGRKPSLHTQSAELRAGDPRSDDLESFLKKCLSSVETRFASAVDAHRALQQLVTANPFSLYTANLALFLYKLLNPESQAVRAQTSDLESTNPVVVHGALPVPPAAEAAPPPLPGVPRRRLGDAAADWEDVFPEEPQNVPVVMPVAAIGLEESTTPRDEADDDALSEARRHARPPLPPLEPGLGAAGGDPGGGRDRGHRSVSRREPDPLDPRRGRVRTARPGVGASRGRGRGDDRAHSRSGAARADCFRGGARESACWGGRGSGRRRHREFDRESVGRSPAGGEQDRAEGPQGAP